MNDELNEERASLYVLGLLDADDARAFERTLAADAELRELVTRLRTAAAAIPGALEPVQPRASLKDDIFRRLDQPRLAVVPITNERQSRSAAFWMISVSGWFAAACLLILIFLTRALTQSNVIQLRGELEDVSAMNHAQERKLALQEQELADLRLNNEALANKLANLLGRKPLDQRRLVRLGPPSETTPAGVVLWDEQNQSGTLVLDRLPDAAADKDYQLWIIDPTQKAPIDCGVIALGQNAIAFNPKSKVAQIGKFAITLEKKGGVPAPAGTMVLIGG